MLPLASSYSLGLRKRGRQRAPILKGEIMSLLPVLGKVSRSQKCLLVTPFVERRFGSTRWKNQNASHRTIRLKYSAWHPTRMISEDTTQGGCSVGICGEKPSLFSCVCVCVRERLCVTVCVIVFVTVCD